MIYKENNEIKMSTLKIKYLDDGEEFEKYVKEEGKQWWIDFEKKWEHLKIIEFIDFKPTEDQLKRFEEIRNLDTNLVSLNNYVENGVLGRGLELLKLEKENENLQETLADLTEAFLLGGR